MVTVEKIVSWNKVLNSARLTVGKDTLNREPSDSFKRDILLSEHSPLRKLLFDVTWNTIPYHVAMHLRTHHVGFKSADDDLYFVKTQRTDRTQIERDNLPQSTPVILNIQINAQSLINVSRVRLCNLALKETREAWMECLIEIGKIEPLLFKVCQRNCIYRGFCPEGNCCNYDKSQQFEDELSQYRSFKQSNRN